MTINLHLSYRPVRIGLLVRSGSIPDLLTAAETCTLLCGGTYNPLIPVGEDSPTDDLIEAFRVDVLHAIADTPETLTILEKYPNLQRPRDYGHGFFIEDWHTKKAVPAYLDILNTIRREWESDFKHRPADFTSGAVLPHWDEADALSALFCLWFGRYPDQKDLRDDYREAFLKGLRARELALPSDDPIDVTVQRNLYPLRLAGGIRTNAGIAPRGDGLYVGDAASFGDLVNFWNLRAAGHDVVFFPIGQGERMARVVEGHLATVDNRPSRNRGFDDHVYLHHGDMDPEEARNAVREHTVGRKTITSQCDAFLWNSFNIEPARFILGRTEVLASVEQSHGGYRVTFPCPEKSFVAGERSVGLRQQLMVSVRPLGESAYAGHTLAPPFLPAMHDAYSREIAFNLRSLRSEPDGVAIFTSDQDRSATLFPMTYQAVVTGVFRRVGITATISKAGVIAQHLIGKLGGIDFGRAFKIRGVRKLLQVNELLTEGINRNRGAEYIWDRGSLRNHSDIYIGTRSGEHPDKYAVFDHLLEKDFLRAGLNLICGDCGLNSWLSLREIDDVWVCRYCGHENRTSLQLRDHGEWKYRKSGLFARDNNQEGALPVLLTLLVFCRIFSTDDFIYTPSLDLDLGGGVRCETDFCVFRQPPGLHPDPPEIAIGECKSSERGIIDQADIDNLLRVWEKLQQINVDCYLVFSKPVDAFLPEEMDRFRAVWERHIHLVLLTNHELEPYEPYSDDDAKSLPRSHAMTLSDMAANTSQRYFGAPHPPFESSG